MAGESWVAGEAAERDFSDGGARRGELDDALEEAGPGKGPAQGAGVWGERGGGRVTGVERAVGDGREEFGGGERLEDPLAGEGIVIAGGIADERRSIGDDVSRRPVEGTGGVGLDPWSCGAGLVEAPGEAGKAFERLPEEVDFPAGDVACPTRLVDDERHVAAYAVAPRADRCDAGARAGEQVHLADRADPRHAFDPGGEGEFAEPRLATEEAEAAGDDGSEPVRADDEPGPDLRLRATGSPSPHPDHPPVRLPQQVGDLERREEGRARVDCGVEDRMVEVAAVDGEGGDRAPVLVAPELRLEREPARRDDAPPRELCVRHTLDRRECAEPGEERGGAGAQAVTARLGARERPPVEEDDPVPRRRQVPGRRRPARPRANHDDVRICGNVHGRSGVYGNARFPAAWGVRSSCRPLKTVLPVPGHQDKPKNRMPVGPCIWEIRFVG